MVSFIAISSCCPITKLSKLLTSCLTTIKEHVKRYCDKVCENIFLSIMNYDVLTKPENELYNNSLLSSYITTSLHYVLLYLTIS